MAKTPLERLETAASRADTAVEKAAEAVAARDALILAAAEGTPRATHAQIADAVGLTPWRIQQILRRERLNRSA